MRRVWRGVAPLLAAALGFAPPASAQPPDPADPAAVVVSDDEAPTPRVVPHRRIVLEPLKEPPEAESPTDRIAPAAAPRPAVDLLAPPAVPPGWWTKSRPPRVVVAPSDLPAAASPSSRLSARPVAAAPAAGPKMHPLIPAAPSAHAWPAAFLVRAEPEPTEIKQEERSETSADPVVSASAPVAAPTFADMRRQIEAVAGREVTGISAETQPDGVVLVRVRVRTACTDPDRGKVLELPQARGAGVRVLLEVER